MGTTRPGRTGLAGPVYVQAGYQGDHRAKQKRRGKTLGNADPAGGSACCIRYITDLVSTLDTDNPYLDLRF